MADVRIVLNSKGIRELLRSEEIGSAVKGVADGIAQRAGAGYASDTKVMPGRVIASAYTETPEAMQDNLDNNTLLRAMQ